MGLNKVVDFSTAKLLKEKGFDEITGKYWAKIKQSDLEFVLNKDWTTHKWNSLNKPIWSAPTIADVVMWLYEKHGIWVECLHRGDIGDFTFKVSKLKKGFKIESHYIHESGFNSPTEAYESAIEYVLKNLI